jgi:hypothetical protein
MRVQSLLCTQHGRQIHICGHGSLYTLCLAVHTAMKLRYVIFYQDVFPVAEFQAGERILALLCVIGKDRYNEGDKGQSSICFWKVESRVTWLNVLRHAYL